ncbi:hypothetical protein D3C78_1266540 [compost metagenome]
MTDASGTGGGGGALISAKMSASGACGAGVATGSTTGGSGTGGGTTGSGATATGAGLSLKGSQSSGITEADGGITGSTTGGGLGRGIGVGGRKSCCSAGTWSGWVAGGTLLGLKKSNRSGRVSMADPPWKCAGDVT